MSTSSLIVCCPPPTAMSSAVTVLNNCANDVGQVHKMIFWRRGNYIASIATAILEATWNTLAAADDDTKAIFSPFVANVELPFSEPREFGGGNETRRGAPIRKGSQPSQVTASLYQEDQDVIANLKKLHCEAIDVLFVNEANQLIYDNRSGAVYGFEIVKGSFNVSDKGFGGLEDADVNIMTFNLKPDWS